MSDTPTTITIEQAAERLGISRTWAYEMAKRGDLPLLQTGKRGRKVLAAALDSWIEMQGQEWLDAQRAKRAS